MGIIEVKDNPEVPKVRCPKCKRIMEMDISPFQRQGITKPIRSNCPFCGKELFSCLLILVDTDLKHLYQNILAIVNISNPENRMLMGEEKIQ